MKYFKNAVTFVRFKPDRLTAKQHRPGIERAVFRSSRFPISRGFRAGPPIDGRRPHPSSGAPGRQKN
ncbi:MAG: hypothetical protein SOX97_04615 [Sutterella sp.]|nr:hypothetical protein [Sutterella sp.]